MFLIITSVFLGLQGVRFQALSVLFIGGLNYLLQKWWEPYEDNILNEMEKRGLIVSTITIYLGLYLLTGQLSSGVRIVLLVINFIALAYFYVYFAKEFAIAKARELKSIKLVKKYFGRLLDRAIDLLKRYGKYL
eukprot:TRINITY_DN3428_c0_g1_i1.p1 TRINITY_DN3428_c0_g1~~TRINITY_DN3428_c0_g1_i1.p1  ORF type:complete len:134 (-),score=6.86 TRINITY_DN3428_c0_g1_i1:95-496(-)